MLLSSSSLQNFPSKINFCINVEVQLPYFPIWVTIFPLLKSPLFLHGSQSSLSRVLSIRRCPSGMSVLLHSAFCSTDLIVYSCADTSLFNDKIFIKILVSGEKISQLILLWKCFGCYCPLFFHIHFQIKFVRFLEKPCYFSTFHLSI